MVACQDGLRHCKSHFRVLGADDGTTARRNDRTPRIKRAELGIVPGARPS